MKPYLSLKETAETLDIGYQTVYRMVQRGELPAAKVAGVWRVKREDLEMYVETRKNLPSGAAGRCARCGEPQYSQQSLAGRCAVCEQPLCLRCFRIEGLQHCAQHAGEDRALRVAELPDADAQGRAAGTAARSAPAPADDAATAALAAARAQLAEGLIDRLVTAEQAGAREQDYLARFDAQVRRQDEIVDPATGRKRRVDDWDALHQREVLGRIGPGTSSSRPLDRASAYLLPKARRQSALVLLAQCVSDLAALARPGFVTRPAGLDALVPRLRELAREAEAGKQVLVAGLAATAGWSDSARAHVAGGQGHAGFHHRLLVPILVDLEDGEQIANPNDPRAAAVAELFASASFDDRVQQALTGLEAHMRAASQDSLDRDTASGLTGQPAEVVQAAFERLADGRRFSLERVDGADYLYRIRS